MLRFNRRNSYADERAHLGYAIFMRWNQELNGNSERMPCVDQLKLSRQACLNDFNTLIIYETAATQWRDDFKL